MPTSTRARFLLHPLAMFFLAAPLLASAADCPWLTPAAAATALLAKPAVTFEQHPAPSNTDGMKKVLKCYFADPAEPSGQLGISVIEYDSSASAQRAFDKDKSNRGSNATSLKVAGQPALHSPSAGIASTTHVLKGERILRVTHVYTQKVRAAIKKDPDGAVISTQELARQAVAKL